MTIEERKLVKILYLIPDIEEVAGRAESLWAYSLGNSLYELQNIPVFAVHLNVQDIVRCDESIGTKPVIIELYKHSGNRTLRVIFRNETSEETCVDIIWELRQRGINYEKSGPKSYSFNITPKDNFIWTRDFLRVKDAEGLLWLYEQKDEKSQN